MYAVIFEDGTQMTLSADDVYKLALDKNTVVTLAKRNGSQTVFTAQVDLGTRSESWQIVANCWSEGERDLFANRGRNAREEITR